MNDLARKDDIRGLMNFLRSRLVRGSLGITRPELYNVTRIGTKKLIEKYIKTISRSLSLIVKADTKEITIDEKLGFFNEVRHSKYTRNAKANIFELMGEVRFACLAALDLDCTILA